MVEMENKIDRMEKETYKNCLLIKGMEIVTTDKRILSQTVGFFIKKHMDIEV